MRLPTFADVDAFVDWECNQDERYEFAEGVISLLPGALRRHQTIVVNVAAALRGKLGAGPVAASGLKFVLQNSSRYPDVLVGFDSRDGVDAAHMRFPTLLIEVLSKSTSAVDRGAKVDEYRAIETIHEYVLIDSQKCWVQTLRRAATDWIVSLPMTQGTLTFESVALAMMLDEIYAGTEL